MKNQIKLKKLKMEGKEKYYYMKFGKGAEDVPDGFLGVATVCLLPFPSCDGEGIVRGIAFCNPLDQFNEKLGRNIALGRAIKAFEHGWSTEAVPEKTPAWLLNIHWAISFLSEFNPKLTAFEQKLLGRAIK